MDQSVKHGVYLSLIIDKANQYYYEHKIAIINKIPPAIQPVKINKQNQITLAYYDAESMFDYTGLANMKNYGGHEIQQLGFKVFEIYGKNFSVKNTCQRFLEQYKLFVELKGTPFILIYFLDYGQLYLLCYQDLVKYYKLEVEGKIKNLTLAHFEHLICKSEPIGLDYLSVLAKISTPTT